LKRITSPEEIEIGKHYFCNPKNGFEPIVLKAFGLSADSTKYLGDRIWATKDNPQAFEKYVIVGPIEMPNFEEYL